MFMEKLLQLMAEKKASDIFLSAGSPISIKINGQIMPVNPQVMDGESTRKIAYEMLTPAQIERFEKDLELNFPSPSPASATSASTCSGRSPRSPRSSAS